MDSLDPWVIWLIFAAVFIIAEVFTHGFFIFWFGVGAGAAAVIAAFDLAPYWQWIVFVVVTLVCVLGSRRFSERISKETPYKAGAERLLGKKGVVLVDIDNAETKGLVKVEGEEWRAESADGDTIERGEWIIVESIEGTRLIVRKE
ncbi:MAG: NfeD family protein [Actinomycetota bacterium]|nr:NfeD family protein [Actinomycetota bacterium]MDD5668048.1 NfeD family protein [Actinomycetota bacterium]